MEELRHERPQRVKNTVPAEVGAHLGWEVPTTHFRRPPAHFLPTGEPVWDTSCSSNSGNEQPLGTEHSPWSAWGPIRAAFRTRPRVTPASAPPAPHLLSFCPAVGPPC